MVKSTNLYSFSDSDDLELSLRTFVIDAQNTALEHHDAFRVGVSGGSLPKTLAKALLSEPSPGGSDEIIWSKWRIFFADERAVPLDHEDSNYKLVKEEILDKIPEKLGQPTIFPIDTECLNNIQEMADRYNQMLVKELGSPDASRWPKFDLLLLGCGPDGHTCSLFPGSPLLRETDAWVLSIEDSPKPPPKRITLSLPAVTHNTKRIGFVATGEGKNTIMKQIFDKDLEAPLLPSALVNSQAGDKVSWFTDSAAVHGVQYPVRRGGHL